MWKTLYQIKNSVSQYIIYSNLNSLFGLHWFFYFCRQTKYIIQPQKIINVFFVIGNQQAE